MFTHEHSLFTNAELRKHERYGDDVPGSVNQSGFKGHPECGFCHERFYGDDELYAHCRDRHERCFICDRRSGSRQQQYYVDYNALEHHFQKEHFLCLDKECLDKKFVVFESQMDLKAHQLEAHPNGLSKDARRDARTVDISSFDYRTPYQPQRQRRGEGRERNVNADAIPLSSAQPLRRDEIAYQRQMAIQSAQSVSSRNFGGQLTRNDAQTVRAPARPSPAAAARSSPPTQEVRNLNISGDSSAVATTREGQVRQLRHGAVIERASNLLGNDRLKINEFRARVSSYRTSELSATELIDAFFSLFDTSSSELGKLIKELADIFEDTTKREDLLAAWSDWRAINEDYPALPGPGGVIPGMSPSSGGGGGKRVLRLKSSTAQSSRSAIGRNGSLSSSESAFPPLSSSSTSASSPSTLRSASKKTLTAWGTSGPRIAVPPPISGPSPSTASSSPSSHVANTNNANAKDAFPALPTAPKPNVLMAGLTRGTVRWDDRRRTTPNAWSGASTKEPEAETEDLDSSSAGKKGKGKKGKQTLFHFG